VPVRCRSGLGFPTTPTFNPPYSTPLVLAGQVPYLSLATTSSGLNPLTIEPAVEILAGSMLRLLVARLPTFRTKVGDQVPAVE